MAVVIVIKYPSYSSPLDLFAMPSPPSQQFQLVPPCCLCGIGGNS